MTGAGTEQTASASDFETLYAGYHWDGESPQLYYVRNRFLLPVMGTWNRRDPLGYVDGTNLYQYCNGIVCVFVDPAGLRGLRDIPVRPPGRMPINTRRGPRIGQNEGPEWPIRTPAASTHPVTHGHASVPEGPWYPTPNGPSLFPYYQEDDPWNLPFWDWFTPGGARGPSFDPSRPSKHVNNIPGNAAGMPMVMTNPDWKRNRRNRRRECLDPALPGPIEVETVTISIGNGNTTDPCRLPPFNLFDPCNGDFDSKFPYEDATAACKSIDSRYQRAKPVRSPVLHRHCNAPVEYCKKANCEPYEKALDSVGSCRCCDSASKNPFYPLVERWATFRD